MLQQAQPHFSLCHVTGLEQPADCTAFSKTLNLLFHQSLTTSTSTPTTASPLNSLTAREIAPFSHGYCKYKRTTLEAFCVSTRHPNPSPLMNGNSNSLQFWIAEIKILTVRELPFSHIAQQV